MTETTAELPMVIHLRVVGGDQDISICGRRPEFCTKDERRVNCRNCLRSGDYRMVAERCRRGAAAGNPLFLAALKAS